MHGGKIETIFYLVGNVSYISNLGITIFLILYSNHLIRVLLRHLAADCRTISVRRPFRFRSQMVSVAGWLDGIKVRILSLDSGDESKVSDLDGAVVWKEDVARLEVPGSNNLANQKIELNWNIWEQIRQENVNFRKIIPWIWLIARKVKMLPPALNFHLNYYWQPKGQIHFFFLILLKNYFRR